MIGFVVSLRIAKSLSREFLLAPGFPVRRSFNEGGWLLTPEFLFPQLQTSDFKPQTLKLFFLITDHCFFATSNIKPQTSNFFQFSILR
jgi:hypothetical protein